MINVERLTKRFGGIVAIDDVSLEIAKGTITGLIGPNGAGKTTLFNVVAGMIKPSSGRVFLDGQDITGLSPHEMFERGVVRTFQLPHEFASLTVRENLMVVPGDQSGETLWNAWFRRARISAEERSLSARADEVMEFLTLFDLAEERAGNLSGGQKKLLELGRIMMANPRLVFVDEVGAGVNKTLLNTIGDAIVRLNRDQGYTFCMIEHDFSFIERLCDPVIVMAEGRLLAQGQARTIKNDEQVIEAYLGRSSARDRMTGESGRK